MHPVNYTTNASMGLWCVGCVWRCGILVQTAAGVHAAQELQDTDRNCIWVMGVEIMLEMWYVWCEINTMNRDEGNIAPAYTLLVHQSLL